MAQPPWVVINPRAIENRESYPRHTCGRDPCTSPQTTNLFTKWTLTGCLQVWINWCSGISVHIIEEWNFNCQSLRALVMPANVWVLLSPFTCLFSESYTLKSRITCGYAMVPEISTSSGKWAIASTFLRRGLLTRRMACTAIFNSGIR